MILIAACVVAWRHLGDRIEQDSTKAAAVSNNSCSEGDATVSMIADPGVAPALQEVAKVYNATKPVVRDHCVQINVRPGDAHATLDGLIAKTWDPATNGDLPSAWIPESSIWAGALQETRPDTIAGAPESLVQSPVVIAVRNEMAVAAGGRVQWVQLSALTMPDSFQSFGHTDITGSARMAVPNGPQSDASSLAAQGYVYNTVNDKKPVSAKDISQPDILKGLQAIMKNAPSTSDGSAESAIEAIQKAPNMSSADIRSVPISEQRLFLATKSDQRVRISIVRPRGATPMLDYPVIRLTAGVDPYASDAVAEFIKFAKTPEQAKIFTKIGFRTGNGSLPSPTATVEFPEIYKVMPTADSDGAVAINRVIMPAAVPPE
ncbi:MAG: substrate-binding domain-containing protein [Gordonia sp. (in: high G+C Gram-positive bacteria)]